MSRHGRCICRPCCHLPHFASFKFMLVPVSRYEGAVDGIGVINSLFVLPVDLRTLGLTSDCERVMNEFRLTVDQYDKQMIHDNPEIQKKYKKK